MNLTFKKKEILDLIKAWLLISLAFAILINNPLNDGNGKGFLTTLIICLITAGLSFIIHELSHKYIATKYYCLTEFKANNFMLIAAILMSFLGFIFAAPGHVEIKGSINKKQERNISLAGPLSNLILATLFLILMINTQNMTKTIASLGFMINSLLGLFNMLPVPGFDGEKIYKENKYIYLATTIPLLIFSIYIFL